MADAKRVLEFVFTAVDETSSVIEKVGGGFGNLGEAVGALTSPFAAAASAIETLDAVLVGVAAAIVGLSAGPVAQFDQSFREISTLVDLNSEKLNGFKSEIIDFGAQSSFSFKQTTNAIYEALSANVAQGDAIKFVNDAQTLSIATLGDLDSTTKLLINTINAYNLETSDAAHVNDILFETVKLGQVRIEDLQQSFGRILSISHTAGLSLEEVGAAMAVLTINGLNADEAATALRALLGDIVKVTPQAAKEAEKLGLDFSVTALQTKGLAGFLEDVKDKSGQNIEALAKLIPNVRGLSAETILAGGGFEKLNQFLGEFSTANGVAAAGADKVKESLKLLGQEALNALEAIIIRFSRPFISSVADVEHALITLFNAIDKAVKGGLGADLSNFIKDTFEAIAGYVNDLASNLPAALAKVDLSGFLQALKDLASAIGGLFGDLDFSSADGLAGLIQRVVDGVTGLIHVTEGMVTAWGPFVQALLSGQDAFSKLDPETQKAIGQMIGFGDALNKLTPALGGISDAINGLALAIGGGSLLKNFQTLMTLAGTTGGWVALAAAVGGSSYVLTNWALDVTGANKSLSSWSEGIAQWLAGPSPGLNKAAEDAGQRIAEMNAKQIEAKAGNEALGGAVSTSTEIFAAWSALADSLGGVLKQNADGTYEIVAAHNKLQGSAAQVIDEFHLMTGEFQLSADTSEDLAKRGFFQMGDTLTFVGKAAEDAKDKVVSSLEKQAEETRKATKDANDFQISWEKIASEERQVELKLIADLGVAQIQAQAEEVKAAFESINVAIESTGSTISSLAQTFAGLEGGIGSTVLQHILEEENERRNKAFDLQEKLVNAQVEYLKNLNDRLGGDQALINVSADGLEPELQSFMFKILERVQIQASQEGQSFLLGLPQF